MLTHVYNCIYFSGIAQSVTVSGAITRPVSATSEHNIQERIFDRLQGGVKKVLGYLDESK